MAITAFPIPTQVLYQTAIADPSVSATVVGERYLRTDTLDEWVAITVGSGAADWVQTTAAGLPIDDATAVVKGSSDDTKLVRIEADALTTGTTRVLNMPDADLSFATGVPAALAIAVGSPGAFLTAAPVTALNNQAENRLVTIGSTTTQLDGEVNLSYDGNTLTQTCTASTLAFQQTLNASIGPAYEIKSAIAQTVFKIDHSVAANSTVYLFSHTSSNSPITGWGNQSVSHGFTGVAAANVGGRVTLAGGTTGGLAMQGFVGSDLPAFRFQGYVGVTTPTKGCMVFEAFRLSAGIGVSLGSTVSAYRFYNNQYTFGTLLLDIRADGQLTLNDGAGIVVGTTTGTTIGTGATQKLGFWGATAVVQPATTGTTTGFTAGAGSAVLSDSTFTGGNGTKAYTIGDIVLACKQAGIMAAS